MQIVIDIDDEAYKELKKHKTITLPLNDYISSSIIYGTPLPKGHGDLIDRNELKRTMENDVRKALSFVDLTDFVWLAPTIIEADKGGLI